MSPSTGKKTAPESASTPITNNGARDLHYRLLAERSLDIVIAHDLDRKMVYVNHAWVSTTGYSVEETVDKPTSTFVAPEYLAESKARTQRRKEGDISTYTYELELLAKNGERIPVEIHSAPINTEDGNSTEILLIARDLREKKKTQAALIESEARFRGFFESAPFSIWEEDFSEVRNLIEQLKKEGVSDFTTYFRRNTDVLKKCMQLVRIIDVNQAAVTMHNAPDKNSLLQAGLPKILSAETLAAFAEALVGLIDGQNVYQAETFAKRITGEKFPQQVQWKVVSGSEETWKRIIVSTQDISDLKKAEEELKQKINDLNVLQATAFTCSQANNIDELIRQITNIIGNTLCPDIYGFLLLDEEENALTPHPSYGFMDENKDTQTIQLPNGITGVVAASQKAILIEDIRESDAYIASSLSIRSELCVPIKVASKLLGVINLESTKPAFFSKADERLLSIIASQVATTIQKLESLKTEQKRRQIAETLQRIAAAITTTLNPKTAIDQILTELRSVIEFTSASVQLLRDDHLEIVGGHGALVLEIEKNRTFPYPGDNPNTIVLQTLQPYIINDAQASYKDFKDMPSIKSWLGIPLITNERPLGLLTLDSNKTAHFTKEDAQTVTSFAHHAAIALENAQLFEAEKKRREEAETLRETALAITSSLNLDQAIQQILEQLARVLPYDSASVQLLQDGTIINLGGRGWSDPETVMKMRLPIPGNNPNTKVITERQVVILDDPRREYTPFSRYPHNYIFSWMGVPLIFRDNIIGMLAVDSKQKGYFNKESAAIAQAFAHQAAIAIENARLFDTAHKRLEEAETLRQAAITINSALSLDVVLETVAKQMTAAINATGCAIFSWDKGKDSLYTLVDYNRLSPSNADQPGKEYKLANYPLSRKILAQNQTTVVQRNNANTDIEEIALMEERKISILLLLPMIAGNKTIGLIKLYEHIDTDRNTYSKEEVNLIQGLVSHAAIAVENARLYNAEKTRRQEAETLRQAALTISSSLDLDEVLRTILASIKRVVPFHSAAVMLRTNNHVEITSGYNLPNKQEQIGKVFPAADTLSSKLIETKHPLILADAQENPSFNKWAGTDYVRGWMGVPLIVRGNVIGYITLDSLEINAYHEKHAELAQIFAHQAAAAIENARLYRDALQAAERRAVLHRVSQDISRGIQSPDETYQAIYLAAKALMACDAFVISLRNDREDKQDMGVYLIDEGKRYPERLMPRERSIITLAEQKMGSFIAQDISTTKLSIEGKRSRFGSRKKIRSMLVSPMYIGEKLIGAISAQSYTPNAHTEEEQILLEMLASHAAAAIENARLFAETERHGKEFAELYKITQDLITTQDIHVLLKTMLERATKLIGVSSGSVYIYEEKTNELVVNTFHGLDQATENELRDIRLKLGEGMAGQAAKTLSALRVDDYQSWEKKSPQYDGKIAFTSVIEIPMIYSGRLLGILSLFETAPKSYHFSEDDERILVLFAAQLASALHSARQFEQITTRLAELEAINHLSTALRTTETPEDMLPILLDELSCSLHIDVCSIWLSDPNSDEVYQAIARGWMAEIPPMRQKNDLGIIGRIYEQGNQYISDDISKDPYIKSNRADLLPANWTGAWVPIRASHAITGVIGVMAEAPRKFDKSDLQILSILAEIAGNAFHRARLHLRTEQQLKRLTALRNIDISISSHSALHITLQLLIEHTIAQLDVDAACILLAEPPTQNLKYYVGSGFKYPGFKQTNLRSGEGLPSKAIQQRNLYLANDINEENNIIRKNWFKEEKIHCYYCVPLTVKGNTLGVLEIFHRESLNTPPEWQNFLESLAGQAAIAIDNHALVKNLKQSNDDLARAYDTTLEGWGKALELRDKETQGHTLSVTELTLKLARNMKIPEADLLHIYRGALLHDIGKMGIPDSILHKPGPLTKDEWKIMRQHPRFAYDMISQISYLLPAADIPYCHHERWDGSGYPRGLKGTDIPLGARIFSVVDVWDALLTDRPYRESWPKQVAIDYIQNESGARFDPKVVEAFIELVTQEDE